MQESEIRSQESEAGRALSVLILADCVCSWCEKKTGHKFINADNELYQKYLSKDGRLITHGICPVCSDEIISESIHARHVKPRFKDMASDQPKRYGKQPDFEKGFEGVYI